MDRRRETPWENDRDPAPTTQRPMPVPSGKFEGGLNMSSSESALQLRLFVAADSPSSRDAQRNLGAALTRAGLAADAFILVDVFEHPEMALEAGVIVTPMLEIVRGRQRQLVAGRLSSESELISRLSGT